MIASKWFYGGIDNKKTQQQRSKQQQQEKTTRVDKRGRFLRERWIATTGHHLNGWNFHLKFSFESNLIQKQAATDNSSGNKQHHCRLTIVEDHRQQQTHEFLPLLYWKKEQEKQAWIIAKCRSIKKSESIKRVAMWKQPSSARRVHFNGHHCSEKKELLSIHKIKQRLLLIEWSDQHSWGL